MPTFIVGLCLGGLIVGAIAWILNRAPLAYEDETGFHAITGNDCKPCPACGKLPELNYSPWAWSCWHKCNEGFYIEFPEDFNFRKDAIAAWNALPFFNPTEQPANRATAISYYSDRLDSAGKL